MRLASPAWLWALLLALSACSSSSTSSPGDGGTPSPDSGTEPGRILGQAVLEGASSHDGISVSLQGSGMSATTDAEGRFTLENVAPGTHTLVARKSGYGEARQSVTVQSGGTASVRLDLPRGRGGMLGTVQVEGLLDASGVTVTLVETGASTTTDALGHFTFTDLSPGIYTVRLQKTDYLTTEQTVDVRVGGATLVTIHLPRERGSVAGVIQLDVAAPHAATVVTLVEANVTTTTDVDGRFVFENVMTGTYTVQARRDHYAEAQQSVEVRANQQSQVTLTLARLRGDVVGTVALSDGASPSGVRISVTETGATAVTNAQGAFSITGVPTGTYALTAQKDGYATGQSSVTVRAGVETSVSMTLTRAQGSVTGTALLEGASNHAGITVTLAGTGASTTTDAQGRFTLSNVSSGTHTVEARMSGYAVARQSIEVRANQSTTVSLSLTRERGSVAGVLQLADGSTPVDITVTLVGTAFSTRTNAAGQFSLSGVPTGAYTLEARKERFAATQHAVQVRAGEQTQVNLTLAIARGHIAGVVMLEGGTTTSGISVALVDGDMTLTDAQGRFAFNDLPTGTYTLTAWWTGHGVEERTVEVRYQETTTLSITLPRLLGEVTGTLQLEGESNHAGISVSLDGHDATATTDAQGRFVLQGVPEGPHLLSAWKAHYAKAEAALDVSAGQSNPVSLSLNRLEAPVLTAPALAVQQGYLKLTGAHFGEARGDITVSIGGVDVDEYVTWSDAEVVVRVPGSLSSGVHEVVMSPDVAWRPAATASLRVLRQRTLAHDALWGMGVRPDNTVTVWGPSSNDVTRVPAGLADVVSVAAGEDFAVTLKADGSLVTWGGSTALPVPADLSDVVDIHANGTYVLALRSNGTVMAFGTEPSAQTRVPEGLQDIVGIAASKDAALAFRADGAVIAWGESADGQTAAPADLTHCAAIAGEASDQRLVLRQNGTVAHCGDVAPSFLPPSGRVLRVPAR
ncbi:carboxypeptidase regulatory-like domain-containing protein [Myxococcus sp. Y35]|uniref:carboxypeptidase regulatory-like domain-containing protein n=1 Tax=Pseudomyxococcus flavus TaxID=3115648 RepID=UPI003CF940ED